MFLLLSFRHFLKLVMVDPLLGFEVILFKIFHDYLLVFSHNLIHFLYGVAFGS